MSARVTAWVALGSNKNKPRQQIEAALESISGLPECTLAAVSSLYRSSPHGPQNQPDYINAAIRMHTTLTPSQLLQQLHSIEKAHDRDRSGPRWGARTLDLDILIYGNQQLHTAELIIPHPEICNRAFVLQPLYEIDPELNIPGHGSVRELLPTVANQKITLLATTDAAELA